MRFIFPFLVFISLHFSLFSQVGNLIWEDNFNDNELNITYWNIETGTGINGDWGTGQIDRARAENITFQNDIPGAEDGCLVITTKKEWYIDRNYTSGRLTTAGKASWGPGHRIVAKVFPRDVKYKGQGFAFWMMPDEIPDGWDWIMWPQGGELDIMEYVGSIPYHNLGSVHYAWFWENNQWQEWNHGHQGAYYSYESQEVPLPAEPGQGGYPPVENDPFAASSGFHLYGIDWYEDRIEFFIDSTVYHVHYLEDGGGFQQDGQDQFAISNATGKRVATSEYAHHFPEWFPYEHKLFVILSAGVGGADHTYGGSIIPEAVFPCSVFIDWVRVYELDVTVGLEETEKEIVFEVFPNPASDTLNIQIAKPKGFKLDVIDMAGRTLIQQDLESSLAVDVSKLEKGVYLIKISNGAISSSKKIEIH